jgi:glutathione synthase/RimK-type ligase-like ATP-grasp enzyme
MKIDKLLKHILMSQEEYLTPYLPESQTLTLRNFGYMLTKYEQVILKPVISSGGFGVIQVSSLGDDYYEIHIEKTRITVQGKKTAYNHIKKLIGVRRYMVQRRILLSTVNKRPFDIRVIIQRRKDSDLWKVTGKIAKVAGKGYIVTNNTRSKGIMLPLNIAIQKSSLNGFSQKKLISSINKVALDSAKKLKTLYPGHRIFGLDIGLDENAQVWIIEVNRFPHMSHFLKLGDKTTLQRIMKYKKG